MATIARFSRFLSISADKKLRNIATEKKSSNET